MIIKTWLGKQQTKKEKLSDTFRVQDAYLCPGNDDGAHITNNSACCGCGNTNLISLSKILNRESSSRSEQVTFVLRYKETA